MIILHSNDLKSIICCVNDELRSQSFNLNEYDLYDRFAKCSGYVDDKNLRQQLPIRISENKVAHIFQENLQEYFDNDKLSINACKWNTEFSPSCDPIIVRYGFKLVIDVDLSDGFISKIYELADQDARGHGYGYSETSSYFRLPDVMTEEQVFDILCIIQDAIQQYTSGLSSSNDEIDPQYLFREIRYEIDNIYDFGKSPLADFLADYVDIKLSEDGVTIYYCGEDKPILEPSSTHEEMKSLAEKLIHDGMDSYVFARADELIHNLIYLQSHLSSSSINEIRALI